jgi:hypothetical protein
MTCFMPRMGTVALCCLGMSLPVLGAPPFTRVLSPSRSPMAAESSRSGPPTHSSTAAGAFRSAHLDLRPPAAGEFGALGAARSAAETTTTDDEPRHFPSPHYGGAGSEDQESRQLPDIDAGHARSLGRAETFVRRFHREGLPVARLWETHGALLSLGLNQKGKPGLWLVQKTH